MTDAQYRGFHIWFKNYVRAGRESDPVDQRNLDLKEEHTDRVGAAMARLTAALGLAANGRRLAAVTALFHDLGRFRQYRQYRTFRDADSDNHAKLSLWELNRHRLLHELDPGERQLIGRAIIFHNRLRLPDHLDPASLLYSRLIRDADKVDILRVMAAHFRLPAGQRNPVVTLGLDADGGVRDEVYHRLLAGRIMSYTDLVSTNEFKVLLLGWVFDINFRPTCEMLRETNDLGAIAATLPATPLRKQALDLINDYLDRCLAGGWRGPLPARFRHV